MKSSRSALAGVAVAAMLCATTLSACSSGGTSTTPVVQAPAQPAGGGGSIGQLSNLEQPASSSAVATTSTTPDGPTVDTDDVATANVSGAVAVQPLTVRYAHAFAGQLRRGLSTGARRPQDSAVNSPLDLTYFGGPVLGSAVSHNLFLNCSQACRDAKNLHPGTFLSRLGTDPFITLLYQYLVGPGVTPGSPLTGRFTKGNGVDATLPASFFDPPIGAGYTNPSLSEQKIVNIVFALAHSTSGAKGGLGHIFHVFVPQNVDTCFPGNTACYSPDQPANANTFAFCGYHGSFTDGVHDFLFTVEAYADVPGCRNLTTLPKPNQLADGADAGDPAYSLLSHELFETATDPLGNAWFNSLLNGLTGSEIGDICSAFDNFVTIGGHRYIIQSEYSDIGHLCVSANLTGAPLTPQRT